MTELTDEGHCSLDPKGVLCECRSKMRHMSKECYYHVPPSALKVVQSEGEVKAQIALLHDLIRLEQRRNLYFRLGMASIIVTIVSVQYRNSLAITLSGFATPVLFALWCSIGYRIRRILRQRPLHKPIPGPPQAG